jgi:serine/threonine protein kinase
MTETAAVPPATSRCPRCHATFATTADRVAQCPHCAIDLALTPPPATPAGPPLPPLAELQAVLPGYELQTLVGRGGMGAVYRARHQKLDRVVAIKILLPDLVQDPAFAERFEREAKALARLDHRGIVGLHDFGRAGAIFYLVMEFVDGANLRELLAQGHLSPREVLLLVPQLCDALQYAHDHRIVHRDIKPENILVDTDGHVRIADFGLAKLVGQDHASQGLTQTRQALGTPHYMAPEQVHASKDVDHRADLYSLGVVLYEMLTGQLPIGRFQPPSAKANGVRGLDPVVMKALENDPSQRYQAATEVKRDVQAVASDPANPPPPLPLPPPPLRGAAAPAARAPSSRPTLPWPAWLGSAVVLFASFLPWVHITVRGGDAPLAELMRDQVISSSSWESTMNVWLFEVPAWLNVGFAVLASALAMLRAATGRTVSFGPLAATSCGLLFTLYSALACAAQPAMSVGVGLALVAVTFLAWNATELRQLAELRASARSA